MLNRIALPSVLDFNEQSAPKKYDSLRKVFQLSKSSSVSEGVGEFFDTLPLPKRLRELGLNQQHLSSAANIASEDIASETNPRDVGATNYFTIMQSVL